MQCPKCGRENLKNGEFIPNHQPSMSSQYSHLNTCPASDRHVITLLKELARTGMSDGPYGRKQKLMNKEVEEEK
jgi:hypothetical protein